MQIERDFTHLIQKQCAAVGESESAHAITHGTGKRATYMAKKFALKQLAWNRTAIHLHQRLAGTGTALVDGAGDEFLACSTLAQHQHVRLCCRHHLHLLQDAPKCQASAQNVTEGSGRLHFLAQVVALQLQFPAQRFILFKSARIGDGDCGCVSHGPEPGKARIVGRRPPENRQDAQHFAPEDQGMAREADQFLRACPFRITNPLRIFRQARNANGFSRASHVCDFQMIGGQRDAVEGTVNPRPVRARCQGRTPTRADMQSRL